MHRRQPHTKRSIYDGSLVNSSQHFPGTIPETQDIFDPVLESNSAEESLPVEISFLVRQHAQSVARLNRLERQLNELHRELDQDEHQVRHPLPACEPRDPLHNQWHLSSGRNPSILNDSRFYTHQNNPYHMYQSNIRHREPMPHLLTPSVSERYRIPMPVFHPVPNYQSIRAKGVNLSDDSGGEYSRMTTSDNDELSSLLDQILRISSGSNQPAQVEDQTSGHVVTLKDCNQVFVEPAVQSQHRQSADSQLDEADNWLKMQQHRFRN